MRLWHKRISPLHRRIPYCACSARCHCRVHRSTLNLQCSMRWASCNSHVLQVRHLRPSNSLLHDATARLMATSLTCMRALLNSCSSLNRVFGCLVCTNFSRSWRIKSRLPSRCSNCCRKASQVASLVVAGNFIVLQSQFGNL